MCISKLQEGLVSPVDVFEPASTLYPYMHSSNTSPPALAPDPRRPFPAPTLTELLKVPCLINHDHQPIGFVTLPQEVVRTV